MKTILLALLLTTTCANADDNFWQDIQRPQQQQIIRNQQEITSNQYIHEMQEQFKARQERAVINQQQFEYDMREQSEGIRRSTMVDDEE
jgi:hypothetical protein